MVHVYIVFHVNVWGPSCIALKSALKNQIHMLDDFHPEAMTAPWINIYAVVWKETGHRGDKGSTMMHAM